MASDALRRARAAQAEALRHHDGPAIARANRQVAAIRRAERMDVPMGPAYKTGIRREYTDPDYQSHVDRTRNGGVLTRTPYIVAARSEGGTFQPVALRPSLAEARRAENEWLSYSPDTDAVLVRVCDLPHRNPSHHIGSCDEACRRGDRSHVHRVHRR